MKQFDNIRAHKPVGIEDRKAYIIGGGIAGLAAAVFLIDDCYVPGGNVTIYDQLPVMGGSMDGTKTGDGKYICRGERELEPYMECLWYLGNKIPSLYTEGRTITEETVDVNKADRIDSKARILVNRGDVWDGINKFKMSPKLTKKMIEMISMPEENMNGMTIEEFFGDTFEEFKANPTWQCFRTMLAFKDYHSIIEMKRYMIRFIQFQPGMERLDGILHTKYNEFDSLIDPILHWLRDKGVNFINDTVVTDLCMDADCNIVTEIVGTSNGQPLSVAVSELYSVAYGDTPRELTIAEIEKIEDFMVEQICAVLALGFDGVEIHTPHGYLLHQFLSPRSNQREDLYGGSTENRCRIVTNILERARKKVGADKAIGVRISGNEFMPGGMDHEEACRVVKLLSEAGANFIDVSQGSYEAFGKGFAPDGEDEFTCWAPGFKKASGGLPVITPSFMNPDSAANAISSGKTDIVSLGRQSVADPLLAGKGKGRAHR